MALSPQATWLDVKPTDFLRATEAGAAAGLSAGRLALEAQSERDRISMEGARLSQQAQIAQMETQARREIAQQNALRQQQELEIEHAYKQQQIGLAGQALEQRSAIARQKAMDAASIFADEQGFAGELAKGTSVLDALAKFPRTTPSMVNALRLSKGKEPGQAKIVTHPELPGFQFLVNPNTGAETLVNRPSHMTANEIANQQKYLSKLRMDRANVFGQPEKVTLIDNEIKRMEQVLSGATPTNETPTDLTVPPPQSGRPWDVFPTSTPAPSGAILPPSPTGQPAAPTNPYKVGGRYRTGEGTMIYKGGDPNDESSWDKE